jgi:hypothetical protein
MQVNALFKPHPRLRFNPSEDVLLMKMVAGLGTGDWHSVARRVPGRNARQCKERWENYLSPSVRNAPWTPEEEELLLQKHSEFGPMWRKIASFFRARTDINVRSRWHLIQRRIRREERKQAGLGECAKQIEAASGGHAQAPKLEDPWDLSMVNEERPSYDSFDSWLNGNPY